MMNDIDAFVEELWEAWSDPWTDNVPDSIDPIWIDGQRNKIPLSKIEDSHLLSIERMLLGRGAKDPSIRHPLHDNWYGVIRNEIDSRGLGLSMLPDHPLAMLRQEGKV